MTEMPRHSSPNSCVRLARQRDLPVVLRLHQQCKAQPKSKKARLPFIFSAEAKSARTTLQNRILDRCLLVAEQNGQLHAAAGIDLDCGQLGELMIAGKPGNGEMFELLIVAAERRAVQFGLPVLHLQASAADESRFCSVGYSRHAGREPMSPVIPSSAAGRHMQRSLLRRQTAYGRRIKALGEMLGIPSDYGRKHRLALQPEARKLTTIGMDVFGREQKLSPKAAAAWRLLRTTALENGIEIQAVSAWRPVRYQVELLQRKLEKGASMEEILNVSAAPGFSEHHTGNAIDITTPGFAILEEEFENSPAFRWMQCNAQGFSFRLSFPRNNRHRLSYEPWHWRFDG